MRDITTIVSDWRLAEISKPPADRGYITVVSSDQNIGKRFSASSAGFKKERMGDSGRYRARTLRCRNLARLKKIIGRLSRRQALINGFVPGTEDGKPFYIDTEKNLRALTDAPPDQPRPNAVNVSTEQGDFLIVGRFKDVFVNSCFLFFDFDESKHMPDELRWRSPKRALEKLIELDPELRGSGFLVIPSSSGRVLTEEAADRPFESRSFHLYIQIPNEDADLVQDYYVRLFSTAVTNDCAFHKSYQSNNGTECKQLQTFFDRSVATPGRLIYAGTPVVEDPLILEDSKPLIRLGKTPRLTSLSCPDARQLSEFGMSIDKNGRSRVLSETSLEVGTLVEPQYGKDFTILHYLLGDELHVRCQTPFRESKSFAAFLNRTRLGIPFVHDVGTQTNHYLNPGSLFELVKARLAEERLDSLLSKDCMAMCAALVQIDGAWLPLLKQAAKSEGIAMADAERAIRKACKLWGAKWRPHRERLATALAPDQDKETLIWDESRASEICRRVRASISERPDEIRVFNYCGRPCEIVFESRRDSDHSAAVLPTPLIRPLTPITIAEKVEAIFSIFHESDDGSLRPIPTPRDLRERLAHEYPHELPVLEGIVMHPIVNTSGEIIIRPGYDDRSGLYFADDTKMAELPEKVSIDLAKKSYKKLAMHLLADFPFASPEDEAAAIAIAVTILCRQSLDIAPAFSISSPDYGTGKTTLAGKVCAGVLGRIVATRSLPPDDNEFQKVMVAELQSGTEVIFIDNANPKREHKSDVLAQVTTSPSFEGRKLGTNEMLRMRTNATIIVTGKNFRVAADLASRFIPIRLEPKRGSDLGERFRHSEPEQWAISNRRLILSHLLRIFKGYADSGMPDFDLPRSRFPAWDKLVRRAIYFASGIDICARMSEQIADDPENERYLGLLSAWHDIFGNCLIPLPQLGEFVRKNALDKRSDTLLDAIESINASCVHRSSGRPKVNSQRLSGSLRAFLDQEIEGLILRQKEDPNRSPRSSKAVKHWCVVSEEEEYKIGPLFDDSAENAIDQAE